MTNTTTAGEGLLPIVAIHGSASSGQFWHKVKGLSPDTRLFLTPDLPGYQANPATEDKQATSLTDRSSPLVAQVRSLQSRVHLVAHSFGGAIAFEIARQIPELIQSISLYEPTTPAIFRSSSETVDFRLLSDLLSLSDILASTSSDVGIESFVNFWSGENIWHLLPDHKKQVLSAWAPIVLRDFLEGTALTVPKYHEHGFSGPIQILAGELAQPHIQRMAQLLTEAFPQAKLKTLRDMRHMGPVTHAEEVATEIFNHIQLTENNITSTNTSIHSAA